MGLPTPVQIKDVVGGPIPADGSASKKIGNNTGIKWSIPGTSNRGVTLHFLIGPNNYNNKVKVEIFRGDELSSATKVKRFQAPTKIDKRVSLAPNPGKVIIRMYQIETGSWAGGFFEKNLPWLPGVSGKMKFTVEVSTNAGTTTQPTSQNQNQQNQYQPAPEPQPIYQYPEPEVSTNGTGGGGGGGGQAPIRVNLGGLFDQFTGENTTQQPQPTTNQPQTTYQGGGALDWLESNAGIVVGGIIALTFILKS